jgi:prepilin-type N-terminal cleavage/methylation domain-containing protein
MARMNGKAPARHATQGFTLVEVMITVAIISVLSLLALVGYARWIKASKTGEATSMLGVMKTAEESYRAETLRYLDASAGNLATWYPTGSPSDQRRSWNLTACAGSAPCDGFRKMNITADAAVYYSYSVIAGAAGGAPTAPVAGRTISAFTDVWYVAQAVGDLDANGTQGTYATQSGDVQIWSLNPEQ